MIRGWPRTVTEQISPSEPSVSADVLGRGEMRTPCFSPPREGEPFVLGRHVQEVSYEGESPGSWWKLSCRFSTYEPH